MPIEIRYTTCPRDCYDTCAMQAEYSTEDNDIIRIKADPANPMTGKVLCPRGAKDHIRRKKGRIINPLLRQGNEFVPISFDKAFDIIAEKIKYIRENYSSKAILYYDYAGNQGAFTTVYTKRLWYALGATLTDWSLCTGAGNAAIALHYGKKYGIHPEELPQHKLIFLWGMNVADNGPHIWRFVRQAQKQGTKVIYIDVRKTRTAKMADVFIQIRPHTDIVLAYAIINRLIATDAIDKDFISRYTVGFDYLAEAARQWSIESASRITGINPQTIVHLSDLYANLRPSATMIGVALQKSRNGWEAVRLLSLLPAVLGQHRGFFYSFSSALDIDDDYLSGYSFVQDHNIIPQVTAAHLLAQGQFKMVFVSSANPAVTIPNARAFVKGMRRPDVLSVVQDTHMSETAREADLILPAPNFLEKEDVIFPWGHNYLRYNQKIVRTDIPTEIDQMWAIAERLGMQQTWIKENPQQALLHSLRKVLDNPQEMIDNPHKVYKCKILPRDAYQTPSGKIEFHSSTAPEGINPVPQYREETRQADEYFLISSAIAQYTNSQFQEIYGPIPSVVHIHPREAEKIRLKNGDRVFIYNEKAEIELEVKTDNTIDREMVWTPRNTTGLNGIPLNALVESYPAGIGRGSVYHSTVVKIRKA